jgi:hypothetical protein
MNVIQMSSKVRRKEPDRDVTEPCRILLFTGVRYERHEAVTGGPTPAPKRTRRRVSDAARSRA